MKLGKKGLEWKRERKKRIKELEETGEYRVEGSLLFGCCKDCGGYNILDLDHKDGRDGEDPHRMDNLDPICRWCHIKRHRNMADKKEDNKNSKSKKVNWMKNHSCKNCKVVVSTLICSNCGKISV
jgi:hypothetical protein